MGLPQCKNLWNFSLFRAVCFSRFHCVYFFVFFVYVTREVSTPRMSQKYRGKRNFFFLHFLQSKDKNSISNKIGLQFC